MANKIIDVLYHAIPLSVGVSASILVAIMFGAMSSLVVGVIVFAAFCLLGWLFQIYHKWRMHGDAPVFYSETPMWISTVFWILALYFTAPSWAVGLGVFVLINR